MFISNVFKRLFASKSPETMVKVLNVAEKNDAAKSIAEVMSRGRVNRREGFSRFNKIYEFEYMLFNQRCNMMMTSVSGHLLGMDFVGQYKKWNSCSPVALFDIQVEKYCPENFIDIKRTLEREVRGAQFLVIWTDCDREGENIGFEIIQVCKAVKPNLQVYRARFSEITPQAIARACQNLNPPDKRTSDAVDVRMELDLRIGAAFTRFQTKRLQKIFPNVLADQLISYGSCQFPTLGFVVERYKQVQAFIPEPFWKLRVTYKMEETTVEFSWKRNRLFDYMACFVLYQHCLESPLARVVDARGKSKSKWRPQALDTVELEKLASRKLRISAKETMKIAEKLYTSGFISYPRTETNIFTKEIDLASMVEQQTRDPNWGDFARRVLERGPTPRNGNKTDNAHPPIHPTKYTDNLQGNEQCLYEFIVRHFLACCSQDAQGFETTVEIDVAEERFTAQGLMVTAKNYLEVYTYEKWNAKEIPVFDNGDEFEPTTIEMNSGETSPPPLLSEADLIALMDKHGIGTDATHAEHIETIKSRNYVGVRPDGRFVPGQLGMGLVEGYDAMGYEMSKPHLRAELEADLKKICEGTKQKDAVLEAQVKKYKEVFIEACRQAEKIDESLATYLGENAQPAPAEEDIDPIAASPVMKCPMCGSDMLLKPKKDNKGFYIGCMGYPNCRNAIWLPDSVQEASVIEETCSRCGPTFHKVKFTFRRGSVPPTVPLEYSGCVAGCDDVLCTDVGIQPPKGPNSQAGTPAGRDSGYGSSLNSSINSVTSRNFSTQASTQPRNNSRNNSSTGNRTSQNNSFSNVFNNSFNSNSTADTNRPNQWNNNKTNYSRTNSNSNTRTPLAAVTGNTWNSGNSGTGSAMNSGSTEGGNNVVCNCGNDAIQLTVRKEGPNTGRQFYKCGSSACNFFLWADEAGNNGGGGGGPDGGDGPGGGGGAGFAGGRVGGYSANRSSNTSYSSNRFANNNNSTPLFSANQNNDPGESVNCKCGKPAKSLTVQKEGPNKGRQFYGCPAPRGEGCNFFQWADEPSGGSGGFNSGGFSPAHRGGGGGSGRGGGVGRKRSATSEAGGPSKARKCGLCGVEGHTKRNCPHK